MTTNLLSMARPVSGDAANAKPLKPQTRIDESPTSGRFEVEAKAEVKTEKLPRETEKDGLPDRLTAEAITQDLLQSLISADLRTPDNRIEKLVSQFQAAIEAADVASASVGGTVSLTDGARPLSAIAEKVHTLVKSADFDKIAAWLNGIGGPDATRLKQAIQRLFDAGSQSREPMPHISLARPLIDMSSVVADIASPNLAADIAPAPSVQPSDILVNAATIANETGIAEEEIASLASDVVGITRYSRPIIGQPAADIAPKTKIDVSATMARPDQPLIDIEDPTMPRPQIDLTKPNTGARLPQSHPVQDILVTPAVWNAQHTTGARPLKTIPNQSADIDHSADRTGTVETGPVLHYDPTRINGEPGENGWTGSRPMASDDAEQFIGALSQESTGLNEDVTGLETPSDILVPAEAGIGKIEADRVVTKTGSEARQLSEVEGKAALNAIADAVNNAAVAGKRNQITIHLRPDDLGDVILSVQRQGRLLVAEVVTTHEAVRDHLNRHRNDLVQTVERQGFQFQDLNVRHEPSLQWNGGQSADREEQAGWKSEFQRGQNLASAAADRASVRPNGGAHRLNSSSGLDLAA